MGAFNLVLVNRFRVESSDDSARLWGLVMWLHEVDFHLAASAFLLGVDFSLVVATIIFYMGRKK